ncbi:kinase-like domain-containing protein [Spinellus fusiger]|nr:kinase-like domain-containing protein [Spinellus fusiger]
MSSVYVPNFLVDVKTSVTGASPMSVSSVVQSLDPVHVKRDRYKQHVDDPYSHHLHYNSTEDNSSRWVNTLQETVDVFLAKIGSRKFRIPIISKSKKPTSEELASERREIDAFLGGETNEWFLKNTWTAYIEKDTVLGKGAGGTVRLVSFQESAVGSATVCAVKEIKRKKKDSTCVYSQKIAPEFYATLHIKHVHVVKMFGLLPLSAESTTYCLVMQYCNGVKEANCFFQQLMSGVGYLHSVGVAHCDLKPENLLLMSDGYLRITDLGCFSHFKMDANQGTVSHSQGIRGTTPFMAPEIFIQKKYDARLLDVWCCALIYHLMKTKGTPWFIASEDDNRLTRQVGSNQWGILGYLEVGPRELIYKMLNPEPKDRIQVLEILQDPWFLSFTSSS